LCTGFELHMTNINVVCIYFAGVIKCERLLDVGTGPSIHSVFEASDHVTDIYLSDFSEMNRNVLNGWWKSQHNLQTELCRYIQGVTHSKYV